MGLPLSHRTLFVLACAASAASPAFSQVFSTNAALPGTPFNSGVRGQAVPAVTINRGEYVTGVPKALEVSRGSSLRGVAGGLEADTFNWKTNNNSYRAGTLDYLRYSRDQDADLYITANIRGLVEPDPTTPGNQRFYDTSIPTLASLAADWVRYTNRIVQNYRRGDTIADPRDQAILNSLVWNKSATPGDAFDKLLAPGEAAVPKVKYWEIGNEPRVGLLSTYKVSNTYTFFAPPRLPDETHKTDFRERYAALTSAMLAEDPTIKVGPAIQFLSAAAEQEVIDSILVRQPDGKFLPIDFLGYHPYQKLNEATTVPSQEFFLRIIYNDHLVKATNIRDRIAAAGRDRNSIKLVASEHAVSNHTSNDQVLESTMLHALGNTESIFSFARLGVDAAHYWIWPAHRWDGTEYPVFKAYEGLRDHMGDTLLSVQAGQSDAVHLYTTRDSASGEIALWGLNLTDTSNVTQSTPITNVGGRGRITLHTLGALNGGATTFNSANHSSEMPGGQTYEVDWRAPIDLTGTRLDNLQLTFNAATITVLTIERWRQLSLPGDVNENGIVDASDAAIISANNNSNERNWQQGDVTGDGLVNSADAALVSANTGVTLNKRWNRNSTTSNTWSTSSNWSPSGVPNGIGANAYLAGIITAPRTISIGSPTRVGTLAFNNPLTYDLVATGTGTFRMENTGTTPARMYVVQGDHRISLPLTLASSTIADLAAGTSLRFGSTFTIASGKSLTKTGAGTLTIDGAQSHQSLTAMAVSGGVVNMNTNAGTLTTAPLTINANAAINFGSRQNLAALNVGPGGIATALPGGANVIVTNTVAATGGGRIDLTDNYLVVKGSNLAAVRALVISGFNAGQWNGPGIGSSSAESDVSRLTTLGYASNADLKLSTFAGVNGLDLDDVLVKYTYYGDADLDGAVDLDDFTQLLAGLAGDGTGWLYGDFDYSGSINLDDFTQFLGGFNGQGAPLSDITLAAETSSLSMDERQQMLSAIAAVPEPGGVGLWCIGALAVGTRRGRRPR